MKLSLFKITCAEVSRKHSIQILTPQNIIEKGIMQITSNGARGNRNSKLTHAVWCPLLNLPQQEELVPAVKQSWEMGSISSFKKNIVTHRLAQEITRMDSISGIDTNSSDLQVTNCWPMSTYTDPTDIICTLNTAGRQSLSYKYAYIQLKTASDFIKLYLWT